MGEIGSEVVKRLYPWGVKILYFDIRKRDDIEEKYPNIEYKESLEEIFKEADILSIHIPLNKHTEDIIDRDLLKLMKRKSLLINTSRGGVLNLGDLLQLLEEQEIQIDFSFDVFPQEPIDNNTLMRIKKIKENQPSLRIILMPHNASADADTRGKMDILFLEDIIRIIESSKMIDLQDANIIPEHRKILSDKKWKIYDYWNFKK